MDGRILPSGYQIALACGPLKKARYINPAIEKELTEFKEEIAEKHAKSEMNKTYVFPRTEVFVYNSKQDISKKAMTLTSGSQDNVTTERLANISNISNARIAAGTNTDAIGLARMAREEDYE